MKFRATVVLGGKTATGLEVPDDIVTGLGSTRRPAVRVTIGSHTYRSTVAMMGGRFMLPLSAENRAAAGVAAGDQVDVDVELDTEPRTVEVPDDLRAALDADTTAGQLFAALSFSRQRGIVEPITQARTPETRARRIARAVDTVREGRAQS